VRKGCAIEGIIQGEKAETVSKRMSPDQEISEDTVQIEATLLFPTVRSRASYASPCPQHKRLLVTVTSFDQLVLPRPKYGHLSSKEMRSVVEVARPFFKD
jgi:hypothetical protein